MFHIFTVVSSTGAIFFEGKTREDCTVWLSTHEGTSDLYIQEFVLPEGSNELIEIEAFN